MELIFPEECTVGLMEEIKASLLMALQKDAPTTLRFHQIERADLSFFQLLHVAEKSFQEAGKDLIFNQDLPRKFAFKAAATNWSRLVVAAPETATPPPTKES